MKNSPKESDWKRFRTIVPELRERYLRRLNKELAASFQNENLTPTEQFWEVEERIRKETKILRDCLDGHRRSSLKRSMAAMYFHKMLTNEDLSDFSEELSESIRILAEI